MEMNRPLSVCADINKAIASSKTQSITHLGRISEIDAWLAAQPKS
jgi:hypothetical protein